MMNFRKSDLFHFLFPFKQISVWTEPPVQSPRSLRLLAPQPYKKKFNTSVNHSYELKMQPTFRIFTKTSPDT